MEDVVGLQFVERSLDEAGIAQVTGNQRQPLLEVLDVVRGETGLDDATNLNPTLAKKMLRQMAASEARDTGNKCSSQVDPSLGPMPTTSGSNTNNIWPDPSLSHSSTR